MLEKRSKFLTPISDAPFTTLALPSSKYFAYCPLLDPRSKVFISRFWTSLLAEAILEDSIHSDKGPLGLEKKLDFLKYFSNTMFVLIHVPQVGLTIDFFLGGEG